MKLAISALAAGLVAIVLLVGCNTTTIADPTAPNYVETYLKADLERRKREYALVLAPAPRSILRFAEAPRVHVVRG